MGGKPQTIEEMVARWDLLSEFKAVREGNASRILPKWLTFNADELTATVVALPVREDIDFALQENMIVEFYSR